ncbi:MAG: hypothetical protein IKD09_05655, partial [Lentisphaeria bacterium]|nr:hypothetical protein [Lentisphaeria bacterium]
ESLKNYMVMGELSLDGSILPVNGVLPVAVAAKRRNNINSISRDTFK